MKRRVPSSLRHFGLAAVLAAGLVAAPSALGAARADRPRLQPRQPGRHGELDLHLDRRGAGTRRARDLRGRHRLRTSSPSRSTRPLTSPTVIDPPEGNFCFKVRSVEPGAVESAYTTLPITVDETGPTATLSLSGPSGGVDGWFRSPLNVVISDVHRRGRRHLRRPVRGPPLDDCGLLP